jgi:hypothetical protein
MLPFYNLKVKYNLDSIVIDDSTVSQPPLHLQNRLKAH